MKIAIILNKHANQTQKLDPAELEAITNAAGFHCDILSVHPNQLGDTLEQALKNKCAAIVVGGGDGSVRTVAQILGETNIPLAIFPVGTYNHFAKDLKTPEKFSDLLQLIRDNKVKQVDTGMVNEQIFINNASVGFYTAMVKEREKYLEMAPKSKLWKIMLNVLNLFKKFPTYKVNVEINGKQLTYNTCLFFVGNNLYSMEASNFGVRETLTEGVLGVYTLKCTSRYQVLKLVFNLVVNRRAFKDYFEFFKTVNFSVDSRLKSFSATLDGEVVRLQLPLKFSIKAKSLRVFAE